jgi:hypothetical protein
MSHVYVLAGLHFNAYLQIQEQVAYRSIYNGTGTRIKGSSIDPSSSQDILGSAHRYSHADFRLNSSGLTGRDLHYTPDFL